MGAPREIQARTLGHSQIEIETEQPLPAETPPFLAELKHHVADGRKQMSVQSAQPARTIVDLVKWVDQNRVDLADIHLRRPTLEDVFIELTGKRLRE